MKNNILFLSLFFFTAIASFSQSISSSPYSLYGLGSLYDANFGSIPSIGSSGIALSSGDFINNLNAASLVDIGENHFLFDVGGAAIQSSFENNAKKESRNNFQFSHISFAFPINKKSAFSVALLPYSSSTFKISNFKIPIQDSQETYNLDVTGSGGLNKFDLSYGYKIGRKLSLGISTSFLFGSTTDDRDYTISNSITSINKKVNYNGIRPILSSQFKIDPSFTLGVNFKSPTKISATKVQTVTVLNNTGTTTIESDLASDTDDFYLPLEIGVGLSKVFKNNLNVTFDYEKGLWNATNQSDLYGNFVDQEKFAFGLSYRKSKESRNYFDRIQYGAGLNYDTGYLEVDNQRINNKALSIGVSLPFERTSSALHISYSYGQKGKISDSLIKEEYHKLSLNLSLDGIWFVKRKIE